MGWFKRLNQNLIRVNAALSFGVDENGKQIVIGTEAQLDRDSLFTNGSLSAYGQGSVVFLTAGGIRTVDGDGLWQTPTITTVSQSASPSASPSPSSSASASVSPSASASLSRSPSASQSPSASASPSA
jgi:hypothetical protein